MTPHAVMHHRNRTRRPDGPHKDAPAEPIRPGELWPISLLHTRLGWGARTRAQAIRQGLRVHRWGKRAYVRTDDLIRFLCGPEPDLQSSSQQQEPREERHIRAVGVATDVAGRAG